MAISKNLMVSIGEDAVAGDAAALVFKTTDNNNIVVEVSVAKFAVKLEDLEEAAKELKTFIANNKHIETTASIVESSFITVYGDEESSNS